MTKYNFAPISNSDKDEIRDSGFGPASSGIDTANTIVSMAPNGNLGNDLNYYKIKSLLIYSQ